MRRILPRGWARFFLCQEPGPPGARGSTAGASHRPQAGTRTRERRRSRRRWCPHLRRWVGKLLFVLACIMGVGGVVAARYVQPVAVLLYFPALFLAVIGSNLMVFGTVRLPEKYRFSRSRRN